MLDRLRRKQPTEPKSANVLAMVLLPDEGPLNAQAAIEYLRRRSTDLPGVGHPEIEDGATVATIPGGAIGLVHVPMRVPRDDLEGPIAVAWHWPTAAADVARHQSHVIVFAGSTTLDAVELRLLHSKLVAAVAATSNAIGVYVGDAMLVRATADYVAEAEAASRKTLPIMLWVGFNPVSDEGRVSAYTTGLTAFELPELEVHRSTRPVPEILGAMADAATYELGTGRILDDGHTFGFSASQRIPVRHTRSRFLPNMTVAVLGL